MTTPTRSVSGRTLRNGTCTEKHARARRGNVDLVHHEALDVDEVNNDEENAEPVGDVHVVAVVHVTVHKRM